MSDHLNSNPVGPELMREFIKEKRSAKRWKNTRFFLLFALIFGLILICFASSNMVTLGPGADKGYVAFIKLNGMIEPGREFSAETVLPQLKDAFSDQNAKGVVIDINSGGGTPVQASIIHDAIINLKKQYHKKVVVVGEDMMASGAYFVAVAGDKIYVNPNTITGSIGVIMKGFGFPDVIKKLGVERRVYTSGINKDRLDPFLPQNQQDVEKIRTVISEIHDNFNQVVLEGRKGKLRADPKELFSGDFWSGQTALKLGLVDGLGNLTDVLQKEFHVSRYRDYSGSSGLLRPFMSQFGMALSAALNDDELKVLEKI